jgi:hypothetical protein
MSDHDDPITRAENRIAQHAGDLDPALVIVIVLIVIAVAVFAGAVIRSTSFPPGR